jgi:alpha-ribazole phosphatase
MKFYVIRHPWTESNVNRILQGWGDSKLTPIGKKMALKLGNYLKNKNISKIFTSDLGRCKQTSKIVNNILNVEIKETKELRELNLGIYNNIPKKIVDKNYKITDYSIIPKDGESFLQMKERVLKYLYNGFQKNRIYLVVTHSGCYQAILSEALDVELSFKKLKTTPMTISLFEIKNKKIHLLEKKDIGYPYTTFFFFVKYFIRRIISKT